jgi:hypothetical protein
MNLRLLNEKNSNELISELEPFGVVYLEDSKLAKFYTPNVKVSFFKNWIDKINISESYFVDLKSENWLWQKYKSNQTMEEILALLPDTAFSLDNEISVDLPDKAVKFYFYNQGKQTHLYEIEEDLIQRFDD